LEVSIQSSNIKSIEYCSLFFFLFIAAIFLPACQLRVSKEIVVYTSVDQIFSEPILKQFEKQSGIRVLPVYDVEAAKTTGLVNRILAERKRPQADVFWSGEFAQTIMLKEKGVLAPYKSLSAGDIPSQYIDKDDCWSGFAGRARVLLVNTKLISAKDYPGTIFDLLQDKWPASQIGIAYPLFGTAATEAAALYATLGPEKGKAYYDKLHDRGVRVVDGNSVVRDLVSSGQLMMGLVDTDDACEALAKGEPVAIDFLGQNDMGTLVIPNTVALIAGAPHPNNAKIFIDFLLSREVTKLLIESGWSHIPLRAMDVRPKYLSNVQIKSMSVRLEDVYAQMEVSKKDLANIFLH
jgi:iron(III) transport system substrate-binding protein